MSSSAPSAYTLFCDDIRPEQGNKYSAMGIYNVVLGINQPKVTLPKLVALNVISLPSTYYLKKLTVGLWNNKKLLVEGTYDLPPPPNDEGELLVSLPVEVSPLETEVGDVFQVSVDVGDFHYRSLPLMVRASDDAGILISPTGAVEIRLPDSDQSTR